MRDSEVAGVGEGVRVGGSGLRIGDLSQSSIFCSTIQFSVPRLLFQSKRRRNLVPSRVFGSALS